MARDIYGVILTEDGGYDTAATDGRREELRQARLADLRNRRDHYEVKDLEIL